MSSKYFNLFDGSLEFRDDKIIIFDKANRNRISMWFITVASLIYSITTTIKGYKRHDNGDFWFGLILTIVWM